MTNDIDIKLLGDKELESVLKNLPYKLQHKVLKRIVSDAANPMVKEVKSNAPIGSTSNLKKSIGKKAGRNKKSATVFVGPRMGGSYKGYIANILEFARYERRYPKKGMALKTPWGPRKSIAGIKRQPFVVSAIERTVKIVEDRMAESTRKIITKEFNKARK